ncbi:MAG: glycosyltransferase [Planctomycetales bacterium]|nr:glycosyltransferase [Planctomycetales bacterium]
MILAIAIAALVLAVLPAGMFLANLPLFCCSTSPMPTNDIEGIRDGSTPSVSVLVPARDEAEGIGDCIETALANVGVNVEVIVLDDDSSDGTASIVQGLSDRDDRVRLARGKPLPPGWNGKQHACKQLADLATFDRFVFIDADVRLMPDALSQLVRYQNESKVGLLSAFPHQTTGTWLERWLIPMMHFILLGYLPFSRMRTHSDPSLAAGCGQLFLSSRDAYFKAGTHQAIKQSRHDGLKLPRAYRAAGIMTDVIDGTTLADCRMYRGAGEVIRGVLKNATEGIANPRMIVLFTILLLGCSLLPVVALTVAITAIQPISIVISMVALLVAHLPRMVAAYRFGQSWFGAASHVPATILFVLLQWIALANHWSGRQIAWRGRTES